MSSEAAAKRGPIAFAVFTLVAGLVGWLASFELLTEYIATLKNPAHIPNCNISMLVTCGPNMDSPQGSIFGFSNTILGVGAFAVPIVLGVAWIAGVRFPRWFELLYCAGLNGGMVLVTWLQAQSIFALGTLCPWCMVVWAVMIPLWWITVLRFLSGGIGARNDLVRSGPFAELQSWAWVFIVLHFIAIATVAQIHLNWMRELPF